MELDESVRIEIERRVIEGGRTALNDALSDAGMDVTFEDLGLNGYHFTNLKYAQFSSACYPEYIKAIWDYGKPANQTIDAWEKRMSANIACPELGQEIRRLKAELAEAKA